MKKRIAALILACVLMLSLIHILTQKLLSQFMETGWAPLETYLSKKTTGRWI